MREAFSNALLKAAKNNPKVIVLTGDHGYALFDAFRNAYPERFINCGIAEQSMVSIAAGLSKAGYIPIVYGLSAFVPIRVLEQYKMDVCYENLHVILIGDGAGMVYSHLGTSHQSTEDIAAVRGIPNGRIYSPADAFELGACMTLALTDTAPAYIRIGKSDVGLVHSSRVDMALGDLLPISESKTSSRTLTFIATGSMVKTAMALSEQYANSQVWSVPVIKPINQQHIQAIASHSHTIVVLEEHTVAGGLGGLVCELTSAYAEHRPRVIRLGVKDRFSERCGTYQYLLQEHALDVSSLAAELQMLGLSQIEL